MIDTLDVAGLQLSVSDDITGRLWEKWAFIAAAGVVTCLLRNDIGSIIAAGGEQQIHQAIAETEAVARAAGHPVSPAGHAQSVNILTEPASTFTSSSTETYRREKLPKRSTSSVRSPPAPTLCASKLHYWTSP